MLEWKKIRLINANVLVEEIANIDDLRRLSTATIGMVLKAVPTIDAIPVEWLRSQIKNNATDIESLYDNIEIEELIEKWHKELEENE